MRLVVRLALLLSLASACSGARASVDDETGRVASAIIGGTASDESQNAVVRLVIVDPANSKSDTVCTGTLVAPDIVLTARHCVSRTEESVTCLEVDGKLVGGAIFEDHRAENIIVVVGTKPAAAQTDAVGATIFHDTAPNLCGHDLALVVLDRKLGSPIAPIRVETSATANERFTAVGWGATGMGLPAERLQRTGVTIEYVGPRVIDLDTGHRVAIGPNEVLAGEADCSGDSGGPALDPSTGAVIGVATRSGVGAPDVNSPCKNSKNVYAVPAGFVDVIDAAFRAAGDTLWSEGNPEPPRPPPTVPAASKSGCIMHASPSRAASSDGAAGFLGVIGALAAALTARRRSARPSCSSRAVRARPEAGRSR